MRGPDLNRLTDSGQQGHQVASTTLSDRTWRSVRGAAVALEAELAEASAKEPEADELGAMGPGYARSFHVLADRRARWALRCIDALVENDLLDNAAGGGCWVATPQQESPAQEQPAQGLDNIRHAQKPNAYG